MFKIANAQLWVHDQKAALDFYTELKVVYVDYTGRKREGNLY